MPSFPPVWFVWCIESVDVVILYCMAEACVELLELSLFGRDGLFDCGVGSTFTFVVKSYVFAQWRVQ